MISNAPGQLLDSPVSDEASGFELWVNGFECTNCHACHEFTGSNLITNIPSTRGAEGHTAVNTADGRATTPDKDFDWIGTAANIPVGKLQKAIDAAEMCPSEAIYISEI